MLNPLLDALNLQVKCLFNIEVLRKEESSIHFAYTPKRILMLDVYKL